MYKIDKDLSKQINVLRFILIVMVVFIHSYSGDIKLVGGDINVYVPKYLEITKYVISKVISSVAVPLFFIISSIFLYSKEFTWRNNIKKKVKSLLVPYLIWNTLWIIFFFLAQSLNITKPYFSNPDNIIRNFGIEEWFSAYLGYFGGDKYPFLYPFWFLRDLFIMNIFSIIIKNVVDKLPLLSIVAVFTIYFSDISLLIIDSDAIVFFILGYYIIRYKLSFKIMDKFNWYELNLLYCILIIADVLFHDTIPLLHLLSIIIGIVFFIKLSKSIINNEKLGRLFLQLSSYSFIIFAAHEFSLAILRKLLIKTLPQTGIIQAVEYFCVPIIIVIMCIFIGVNLKRFTPQLYKLLTGNRIEK